VLVVLCGASSAAASGVKRACSAFLPGNVIETTTFMFATEAQWAKPLSRLSPSGTRLAAALILPASKVALPVAPALGTVLPAWAS